MQKKDFVYKVFKVSIILALIGLVFFLTLIPISYSLSIGWILGAFASLLSYLIAILLIKNFFKKKKNWTIGFWLGWLRFYISIVIHSGIFISVIAINSVANKHGFGQGGLDDMLNPINIFTYIGGISIIFICTIVVQSLSRKEDKHDK